MQLELKQNRLWKKAGLGILCLLLPFIFFQAIDFLQIFELQFLDFLIEFRGTQNSNSNLILVTMDDQTGGALGSPLPGRYYPQVLRALKQYGAQTIAVDLLLTEMDRIDPKADTALATLTQEFGNVIHSIYLEDDPSSESPQAARQDTAYTKFAIRPQAETNLSYIATNSLMLPSAFFLHRFPKAGAVTIFYDLDEQYRRLPLFLKYRGQLYPELCLLALCDYLQIPADSIKIKHGFWGYHLTLETARRAMTIPVDEYGQALLNFDGALGTFKTYSILQIVQALQDIEEKRAPQISLHDFAGKIVVIGNNETLGKDYFPTPFTDDFPGMGMQATALSNFLGGTTLREWPWYVNAGLTLLLGLMLSAGLLFIRKAGKKRETIYAWSFFGCLILAYNMLAYFLLFKSLNVAPAILPINSGLVLLFVATMFYEKSLNVERLNRQVRELEVNIHAKDSHIQNLKERIGAQDEQYKAIEFFIGEIESVLNDPAAEQMRSLETPLMKMQLFKEQLKDELERRHVEKQILETEKEALASQIQVYKSLVTGIQMQKDEKTLPPEKPAPKEFEATFQEVNRVLDSYRAFAQRTKSAYHYDAAFGMVTAVMNGRSNGQNGKTQLQEIFAQIARVAPYDSTVLITGETGTGKELVARDPPAQHAGDSPVRRA